MRLFTFSPTQEVIVQWIPQTPHSMTSSPQTPLAADEYLHFETDSAIKHEYINGDVFAMAGANDVHYPRDRNL